MLEVERCNTCTGNQQSVAQTSINAFEQLQGGDDMNRWMLWVLMGATVGALVLAGCGGSSYTNSPLVRGRNVATDIGRVDLYVIQNDEPGNPTAIANLNPMFVGIGPGEVTQFARRVYGDYEFVFTDWNSTHLIERDYLYLRRDRQITVRLEGTDANPAIGFNIVSVPQ